MRRIGQGVSGAVGSKRIEHHAQQQVLNPGSREVPRHAGQVLAGVSGNLLRPQSAASAGRRSSPDGHRRRPSWGVPSRASRRRGARAPRVCPSRSSSGTSETAAVLSGQRTSTPIGPLALRILPGSCSCLFLQVLMICLSSLVAGPATEDITRGLELLWSCCRLSSRFCDVRSTGAGIGTGGGWRLP